MAKKVKFSGTRRVTESRKKSGKGSAKQRAARAKNFQTGSLEISNAPIPY